MSSRFAGAVAFLLVLATARVAAAQCSFDLTAARGIRASMVRMHQPCPGTPFPDFPNIQTAGGTPACTPVTPREYAGQSSFYAFARNNSGCKVDLRTKVLADCGTVAGQDGIPLGLPAGACQTTVVRGKCEGIRDQADRPIGPDDDGWTLRFLVRLTLADPAGGDMTTVDLPVVLAWPAPSGGKLEMVTTLAESLSASIGVADAALPPCTSMEVRDIRIADPESRPFATVGMATTP